LRWDEAKWEEKEMQFRKRTKEKTMLHIPGAACAGI
jgi:hypothetical protein